MGYIYICNYNNYYNRQLKREGTFQGYANYVIYSENGNAINFTSGDGVTTKYVAGRLSNSYEGQGDYLVYSTDGVAVTSRWFIVEADKLRGGQFSLTLYRDVLADNYDLVVNSPLYIEKATVSKDSPFIYNKENFSCNQIKRKEDELFDETGCAWIVGFVDRKGPQPDGSSSHTKAVSGTADIIPDFTANTLNSWNKYNLLNTTWYNEREHGYYIYIGERKETNLNFYRITIGQYSISASRDRNIFSSYITGNIESVLNKLRNTENLFTTLDQYRSLYIDNITQYNSNNYTDALNLVGKVLKTNDSVYNFTSKTQALVEQTYKITQDKATGYLKTYLQNLLADVTEGTVDAATYTKSYSAKVTAVKTQLTTWVTPFPDPAARLNLKDAPYDMFAIPYGNVTCICEGHTFNMTKQLAMSFAQGIAQSLGNTIFDIQIQPYCPASGLAISEGVINFNTTDTKRYSLFTTSGSGSNVIGAMLWCTASSGEKVISYDLPVTDIKVMDHCYKYRLSSGNHAAAFDFYPADNGGISGFNVIYSYMPINSYVRVAPIFGGLYGSELHDGRGMIQQGDYSITYINDTWTTYQNSNKNYLNAFNRGIENLETQRKYQRIEQLVGGLGGAGGAAAQLGLLFGPIAGGVGAALSAGAGVADYAISEKLYKENLSNQKDQFSYQLDNIKATPNTLAKVVAYSADNKVVPLLEVYSATDEEIQAFKNMLKYQGMTVGAIGKINDYLYNSYNDDKGFIKGKFLQLPDIEDDYHMAQAINQEIQMGVYTK